MASKLNAEWHRANKMPHNPTREQRITWHAEHVKHCVCRKPTGDMLAELQKRGVVNEAGDYLA